MGTLFTLDILPGGRSCYYIVENIKKYFVWSQLLKP